MFAARLGLGANGNRRLTADYLHALWGAVGIPLGAAGASFQGAGQGIHVAGPKSVIAKLEVGLTARCCESLARSVTIG